MEMFRDYPCMVRQKSPENLDAYKGHVLVNERSFPIELRKTPSGWIASNAKNDDEIYRELNAQNYQEPHQYLDALTSRLKPLHPRHQVIPTETYRKLLKEYEDFVNFNCYLEEVKLHPDLTAISVLYVDEKFRNHYVTISVNDAMNKNVKQGKLFRIAEHKLPEEIDAEDDSLISLFQAFVQHVETYQMFFDTMDLIDQNFWILHPKLPNRSDTRRRVYLNKNFSAEIIFNPKYPRELPFVNLYGPPKMVQPFEKVLQSNFKHWHEGGDILDELLKFFDMAVFPSRRMESLESAFAPCGVCQCHLGERDELPEMFCPNAPCEQSFHVECLYNCLRQSRAGCLAKVTGRCPFCRQHIECGDPTKRKEGEGNTWW